MLSDVEIREAVSVGRISIESLNDTLIRPCSCLLSLSSKVFQLTETEYPVRLDDEKTYPTAKPLRTDSGEIRFEPGEFYLAATEEAISLDASVGAILANRTGIARLGLAVEFSSLISPGWGFPEPKKLTLEVRNTSKNAIIVNTGTPIVHIIFFNLSKFSSLMYDNDIGVHGQSDAPERSRFHNHL